MAGKNVTFSKAYKLEDSAISLYTVVIRGTADGSCKAPASDNLVPLGVVDSDERVSDALRSGTDQTGRNVAVTLEGIALCKITASAGATIAYGDRVTAKTGGTIRKMATASATYNVLGFAEKAGGASELIPVRLAYHTYKI
jgi:hypothetical protein